MVDLGKATLAEDKMHALDFNSAEQIREEMDRVIPLYQGIKNLKKEKDVFQYGGPMLLKKGVCSNLPDGRAIFSVTIPQNEVVESGKFYLTTRRGKQFNSILYGTDDPLIDSLNRDEIFVSRSDAKTLQISEGQKILLKSDYGELEGTCRIAEVHPGTVQAFWPEANVLIGRVVDKQSNEPDYNTIVSIRKISPDS
jgi:predicted molibdopterin-dependent oxidoreductase YjgC